MKEKHLNSMLLTFGAALFVCGVYTACNDVFYGVIEMVCGLIFCGYTLYQWYIDLYLHKSHIAGRIFWAVLGVSCVVQFFLGTDVPFLLYLILGIVVIPCLGLWYAYTIYHDVCYYNEIKEYRRRRNSFMCRWIDARNTLWGLSEDKLNEMKSEYM